MPVYELFGDESGLPKTTLNKIPYEIESLSYREQWEPGANRTVIVARVKYQDKWTFVSDMVGKSAYVSTSRLARSLPESNPYDPKQYCLSCHEVEQGGNDSLDAAGPGMSISGWPYAKWIKFRCVFEAPPFKLLQDGDVSGLTAPELCRYVFRRRHSQSRELGIPGGGFRPINDSAAANTVQPIMVTGFRVVSFADVEYTLFRWPVANLPISTWQAAEGKINSATFDPKTQGTVVTGGYEWAAGNLLFAGWSDDKKYWDANEDWVCDPVLHFRYNSIGWNNLLDQTGTAVAVSDNNLSSGNKPYGTVDFHTLITLTNT